jgi:hypothetical protein
MLIRAYIMWWNKTDEAILCSFVQKKEASVPTFSLLRMSGRAQKSFSAYLTRIIHKLSVELDETIKIALSNAYFKSI